MCVIYVTFEDLTDTELLDAVSIMEGENFVGGLSNAELSQEVCSLEEQIEIKQMWGSDSNSQILHDVISVEEQENISAGMIDSQLLHDVTIIESSLNSLLKDNAPCSIPSNIAAYLQWPIPTLRNNILFAP